MKATTPHARVYAYWTSTVLLAAAFALGSGFDLAQSEPVLAELSHLGYPSYFAILLGVWKLLGAVALTIPGQPRLKEWAYAGMFFDLSSAAVSHWMSGDGLVTLIAPAVLTVLLVTSYSLRPDSRTMQASSVGSYASRGDPRSSTLLAGGSSVALLTSLAACSVPPPSAAPTTRASTVRREVESAQTAVLDFWREAGPSLWFAKDAAFDQRFRERFLDLHEAAVRGELSAWQATPEGTLALIILLDQFPRNAFRGSPRMYASDARARAVAHAAIEIGHDRAIEPSLRTFVYLPFGHSEDLVDQERSVRLCESLGEPNLSHAEHHRDIVRRFGRFPHRNQILGRPSTPEEIRYLAEGGYGG